jgi:hypothetical protein
LSAVFRTLHLLAFLFHTVLQGVDPQDLLVRQALSARQTFFQDLQALTRDLWCDSWDQWLDVMIQGLELVTPTNAGSHVKMRIAACRVDLPNEALANEVSPQAGSGVAQRGQVRMSIHKGADSDGLTP